MGRAQTNNLKSIFSFDFNYLLTGLTNNGVGLGVKYEHAINNYFSVKGGFGHITFKTGIDDVYCTSIHLSLSLHGYLFGKGLNKLYFGIGAGADFMNYFGEGIVPETGKDTILNVTPNIGYKLFAFKYLLFDFNVGYKINVLSSNNYYNIQDYINLGIQFNIGTSILLSEIIKTIKTHRSKQ